MRWRFCRKGIGRKQPGLPLNSTSCHGLTMHCSLQSEAAYCSCGTRLPGSTSTSHSANCLSNAPPLPTVRIMTSVASEYDFRVLKICW